MVNASRRCRQKQFMPHKDDLSANSMRLDKWLWCARFFKTRAQAAEAVKSGKVKVNGDQVKPARLIKPADELSIRQGPYSHEITLLSLAANRRSAAEAALLYREHEESLRQRELTIARIKAESAGHPRTRGRPTKRERRTLTRFKQSYHEGGE